MGANIVRALLTNAEFDQSYVYQASRSRAAGESDAQKQGMMIKVIAAGKAMMAKRSWCEMRLLPAYRCVAHDIYLMQELRGA